MYRFQVWSLTEHQRIVFFEPDVIFYRGVDWLFEKEGMWAARDDSTCDGKSTAKNAGIMLLHPSTDDFVGLAGFANRSDARAASFSEIVTGYFEDVNHRPIHRLSQVDADYGKCMGSKNIPSPYRNIDGKPVRGAWSTPAMIQRSGALWYSATQRTDENVCFSVDLARQTVRSQKTVNVCQYHSLAPFWRDHLCQAARTVMRIQNLHDVRNFCDDACYYRGVGCLALLP